MYGRSEIFVLEAHRLKVAAGIFALATALAGQITVPMDSVMGPLLPTAAGLLAEAPARATEAAARTLRVTSVLASFTMAAAVPLVCVAIPLLYGSKYDQARVPFLVLGLVSCLGSVTVPLTMFILATRNAGSMLRVNLICLAVDAALAIGLVPLFGLWGAVTANAAAQLLSFGLLTVVAIKHVRHRGPTCSSRLSATSTRARGYGSRISRCLHVWGLKRASHNRVALNRDRHTCTRLPVPTCMARFGF